MQANQRKGVPDHRAGQEPWFLVNKAMQTAWYTLLTQYGLLARARLFRPWNSLSGMPIGRRPYDIKHLERCTCLLLFLKCERLANVRNVSGGTSGKRQRKGRRTRPIRISEGKGGAY